MIYVLTSGCTRFHWFIRSSGVPTGKAWLLHNESFAAAATRVLRRQMTIQPFGNAVTNIAAFAVTTASPQRRDLDSYRGLRKARPWLASSLFIALLGLVGTPPPHLRRQADH